MILFSCHCIRLFRPFFIQFTIFLIIGAMLYVHCSKTVIISFLLVLWLPRSFHHNHYEIIHAVITQYKVVQIWPGRFVCKQVTVCPGHIWSILYFTTAAYIGKQSPKSGLFQILHTAIGIYATNQYVSAMNCSSVSEEFTPRNAQHKFLPFSCHGRQWVLVPEKKHKEESRFVRQCCCLGSKEGSDWWPVLQFGKQLW
jgi:hypothetical protein